MELASPTLMVRARRYASLAELAYDDNDVVEQAVSAFGYSGIHFFDRDGVQAFMVHDDQVVIVVFRGTELQDPRDILTDLKIRKRDLSAQGRVGRVHRGFSQALDKIWDDVEQAIACLSGSQYLMMTGHSLGGALAVLAANRIGESRPVGLMTFGCPRVGDTEFCADVANRHPGQHMRFVNGADVVPMLPFFVLGYRHSGTLCYIDRKGQIILKPNFWRVFLDRSIELFTAWKEGFDGFYPVQMLKDHSIKEYCRFLKGGLRVWTGK